MRFSTSMEVQSRKIAVSTFFFSQLEVKTITIEDSIKKKCYGPVQGGYLCLCSLCVAIGSEVFSHNGAADDVDDISQPYR